jgi:hypothetical protein
MNQLTTTSSKGYLKCSNLREIAMPSRMMKTKTARKIRQARKGKTRKRKEQNKGTTPKFSVHID